MIFLPQPSSLSYGEGTFTIHYDSRIFLDSESPAELFSAAQLLQQEIDDMHPENVSRRDSVLPSAAVISRWDHT